MCLVVAGLVLGLVTGCTHTGEIAPGVSYRVIRSDGREIHVARVRLDTPGVRIVASGPESRGLVVSTWAAKSGALVAVNADYFDEKHNPVGIAAGPEGPWGTPSGVRRQTWFEVADGRARLVRPLQARDAAPATLRNAVSGWPVVVKDCRCLGPSELPGSDHFTRAPHPRTAIGIGRDGLDVYFVVADGRREGIPGLTLSELGCFMSEVLDVCEGLNLDGGGSTTMVVNGRVVNQPSDGSERAVANSIGVVAGE